MNAERGVEGRESPLAEKSGVEAPHAKFFGRAMVAVLGVAGGVMFSGCAIVHEGPTRAPGADAPIIGQEPQHAPIPQKNVPAGESSLRKRGPDQPLVPVQP